MVLLHDALCINPNPIKALVCTLIGISTSMFGGSKAGKCNIMALVNDSSALQMLEALIPNRMATLVN